MASQGKNRRNLTSLFVKKTQMDSKNDIWLIFSQFVKTEFSYIKHWNISDNSLIAFRIFGIAIPYGNSKNVVRNHFLVEVQTITVLGKCID